VPDHLRRLAFVRRARGLGFTPDKMRTLLDLADQPDRGCAAVDNVARTHLAEVDCKLADLARLRHALADLIDRLATAGWPSAESSKRCRPAGATRLRPVRARWAASANGPS
jgi:DNA-binding transcriptional MerR regulator